MFKKILFLSASLLLSSSVFALDSAEFILQVADEFRASSSAVKILSKVELYKNGKLDRTKTYTVYSKPNRRSLILFTSNSEVGQKALILDDKFWLFMPRSRRPIRITPMQKLLGEASTGDIANLSWSEDYQGEIINAEDMTDGKATVQLNLDSQQKGTTYKRIELWVSAEDYRPIKANLYLTSGKLAKQVSYGYGFIRGKEVVETMTFSDSIKPGRKTVMTNLDIEEKSLPGKVYNPAYLIKNKLETF